MRISWVYAQGYSLDPTVDINKIKDVGPTWGGWQTWRSCGTDNVICHELSKARELTQRAFHAVCNFYIPKKNYESLSRPVGVKLYEGEFPQETLAIQDIISLHLAAQNSDIVLMMGFDLATPVLPEDDRFEKHRILNQHGLIRGVVSGNPDVQWVVVDHAGDLDKAYQILPNLTCDNMENVIQLLV